MKRKTIRYLASPKRVKGSSKLTGFTEVCPESICLDPDLLAEHSDRARLHCKRGVFPGRAVCIIYGRNVAYCDVHGYADVQRKVLMTEKSRVRGYSLTKPITAVGLLLLVEKGKLSLDDPVSKYIPSFANCKVVKKSSRNKPVCSLKQEEHLEPLQRAIRLRDCLLHTAGLAYGPGRYDFTHKLHPDGPVEKSYAELVKRVDANEISSLTEFCDALAAIPLRYQPGTQYLYSHGLDVVGAVIEAVTGKSLHDYLRTQVFEPLDMKDTTFRVPRKSAETTLCAQYKVVNKPGGSRKSCKLVRLDYKKYSESAWVAGSPNALPKGLCAGGGAMGSCKGGLVFSLRDLARFLYMLMSEGISFKGKRFLKAKTVKSLFRDWLPRRPLKGFDDKGGGKIGWSPLGHVEQDGAHKGAVYMGGEGYWWCDAKRKLAAIIVQEGHQAISVSDWDKRDDLDQVLQKALKSYKKKHSLKKKPQVNPKSDMKGAELELHRNVVQF